MRKLMLLLKTNYSFKELLLDEAIKAEDNGNDILADKKLSDAINSDSIQKESIDNKVYCAESVGEFIEEFSDLDKLNKEEKIFGSIVSKAKKGRMKIRKKLLRRYKKDEEDQQ